jgi:hypothetical protein
MPEGPPPDSDSDANGNDSDDSDDIPLPAGPPPPKMLPNPPLPPPPFAGPPIHFPPSFDQNFPMHGPMGTPMSMGTGMGMGMGMGRPPPNQFPPFGPPQHQFGQPMGGPGGMPGPSYQNRPVRPPRPRGQAPTSVQDPLSDQPSQTYQGHRASKHDLPARPPSDSSTISASPALNADGKAGSASVSGLPAKPQPADAAALVASSGAGTISAAPVLRDLRKEATTFVPRGVKRKKAAGTLINAAPGAGEIDAEGDEIRNVSTAGSGLLGKLTGVLGDLGPLPTGGNGATGGGKVGGDDEYQRFLEGLGELK